MVHSPYTAFFGDAFMAAHGAIGILLFALLWSVFPRANAARFLMTFAIAAVITAPVIGDMWRGLGGQVLPDSMRTVAIVTAAVLAAIASITQGRIVLAVLSVVLAWVTPKLHEIMPACEMEITAIHMIWLGIVIGVFRRGTDVSIGDRPLVIPARARRDDVIIFIGATLTATLVAIFVLQRADGSADEWAYTWQAATFARLHIYGAPPPCEAAFQNFYVFSHVGRWFGQYTPGWPMFMTPFALLGVPWIAGPFSHGLFAVGIARVARSAVRLDGRGTEARVVAAGRIAAICATLATTTLLVGASRYSHVFAAALFAWALESILVLRDRDLSHKDQIRWGVVFGSAVALMGATRPADGATLAMGLVVLSFFNLVTRRFAWRAVAATFGALAFWGVLVLLILHAQLGEWFTTGYSLNKIIHPWNVVKYAWPRPGEWKFALPLATGSYAWFPLSFAVGLAGLATLRRGAQGITVALLVSAVVFDTYYQYLDLGRPYDWGYGPRYETPLTVVMAIGTGVALAPLAEHWRRAQGPLAIASLTIAVTLVRLWPLLYPGVYAHVHQHDSLNRRAREMGIHDAVVIAQPGATGFDALDLTENLPMDLYPNQDVLIAIERKPQDAPCVRNNYATRRIYRATGNPVAITPY